MDNHQTVNRGGDSHVLNVLFGLIHSQARLVAFFLADGQRRFVGGAVSANILFKLREGALGLIQRKNILLRIDFAQQLVFADFQLGAAHGVLGFQQRGLVFGGLHGSVGLGLGDFLFRLH